MISHVSTPAGERCCTSEQQPGDQADAIMIDEQQQQNGGESTRLAPAIAVVTLPAAMNIALEGVDVDMSDMVDAKFPDVLKEVARLRRHLLEMERQSEALSQRPSGNPPEHKGKVKRMMSIVSMQSMLSRSHSRLGDGDENMEDTAAAEKEGEGDSDES